jgi:GTPase Era involved in 16S rRNA processing
MVDFSDWESAEDAVYDTPGFKADKESRQKAMQRYLELSQQLEDELVAEMGQEEYDASQHWINNPLIKPRSKVAMFEKWEARIRKEVVDEIVELLENPSTMSNWWSQVDKNLGLYGNLKNYVIALIKGEKK